MNPTSEILNAHDRYARLYPRFGPLLGFTRSILAAYADFITRHPDPPASFLPDGVTALSQVASKGEVSELASALSALSPPEGTGRTLFGQATFAELERFLHPAGGPEAGDDVTLSRLLLLKPFFFRVRDRLVRRPEGSPGCPACGCLPYFARIEKEENRRFLVCPLCETQWSHPRFACPFCGVQTREGQFYASHEWPLHRIDACGGCGAYIKTAVEKERAEIAVPMWEDLVTADLDRAAEAEGLIKVSGMAPSGNVRAGG
jgi:transcription elongation factor Elf1